jgi:BMFP domain-containing protein YqiC
LAEAPWRDRQVTSFERTQFNGRSSAFFDDLAGVAGGAISALAGMRQEVEAIVRARIDEAIRALDLVRRDEYDAMAEMAARARDGQEAAEARVVALEERLAVVEARLAGLETAPKPARIGLSGNGMSIGRSDVRCGSCGAMRHAYRLTTVANPKGIQNFSIPWQLG